MAVDKKNTNNLKDAFNCIPENQRHFREVDGSVKSMLNNVEGITYQENPLDFYIMLARYKFAARLLNSKTHNVIDVGCGTGIGSVFLSKFSKTVVGADYDSELINQNSLSYSSIDNLTFKTLDLINLGNEDVEAYDTVVSMDVIEHFNEEKMGIVVENYSRLLKSDGFAIIGTPNIESRKFASKRRLSIHPFEFDRLGFERALKGSFKNVFIFSMNDEMVSTQFPGMAWYLMALCIK